MKPIKFALALLGWAALIPAAGAADEVLDNLRDAIAAYEEGEVQEAAEIVDYVKVLLDKQAASAFGSVLPEALAGWSRELGDGSAHQALGFAGGGIAADATYTSPDGKDLTLTIIADNPMVAAIGAQLSSTLIMAQLGEVKRINRQKVLLNNEGGLQALIDNRFLIQMEGSASQDDMVAYFKALDISKMREF